jgi:Glycosyltransferases involved in cell wall biogenesis
MGLCQTGADLEERAIKMNDTPRSRQESSISAERVLHAIPATSREQVENIGGASTSVVTPMFTQSLSVVLPAYNEEYTLEQTVRHVSSVLQQWVREFEIVVVNDGSQDQTGAILERLALEDAHVRVITHPVNRGYGAALVSGFAAASKELMLFMDSDGQFDIQDLRLFAPYIEHCDAVLGYRIDRQDTWMRKLNAWGWKMVVRLLLGVNVRDIDCAFKLYKTYFIHQITLETRGAMINAEMLYKFKRLGYTWQQVGVHHLPRRGGKATGANIRVILRAFKELFVYSLRWHRESINSGSGL